MKQSKLLIDLFLIVLLEERKLTPLYFMTKNKFCGTIFLWCLENIVSKKMVVCDQELLYSSADNRMGLVVLRSWYTWAVVHVVRYARCCDGSGGSIIPCRSKPGYPVPTATALGEPVLFTRKNLAGSSRLTATQPAVCCPRAN
jgi:hypothetical protein